MSIIDIVKSVISVNKLVPKWTGRWNEASDYCVAMHARRMHTAPVPRILPIMVKVHNNWYSHRDLH